MTTVVDIRGVSRTYRKHKALDGVDLQIPEGCVLGVIGENGAGKTTLMKHILGLLKPETGQVTVFGQDPVQKPEVVLAQIGYLSEDRDLPSWMTIGQYLNFRAGFYPDWDQKFADELMDQFQLTASQRIRGLSRGQHARAGLVAAVAFRPRLLLLDEPSSGLDPAVRHDILTTVIQTVNEQGRTVVFSSHLLDEVQQVCDRIAVMMNGKLVVHDALDNFLNHHCDWQVRFQEHVDLSSSPALVTKAIGDYEVRFCTVGPQSDFESWLEANRGAVIDKRQPALEEIFVHYIKQPATSAKARTQQVAQ